MVPFTIKKKNAANVKINYHNIAAEKLYNYKSNKGPQTIKSKRTMLLCCFHSINSLLHSLRWNMRYPKHVECSLMLKAMKKMCTLTVKIHDPSNLHAVKKIMKCFPNTIFIKFIKYHHGIFTIQDSFHPPKSISYQALLYLVIPIKSWTL